MPNAQHNAAPSGAAKDSGLTNLLGLTRDELEVWVEGLGEKSFQTLTSTPLERRQRCLVASFWQLSTEIPRVAPCVALADSQRMYTRHAEPAGWLRGAIGEAEERERSCVCPAALLCTMASGAICQRTARASRVARDRT